MEAVDDEATIAVYIRHFPYAEQYLTQLDFTLYRLRVREAHYIAGFAKVHWLTSDALEDVRHLIPMLERLHVQLTPMEMELVVPMSILIDSQRRLAVWYKGAVEVEIL